MVDWLAGKRVRGTSSERTPLGVTLGGTGVGGWVELGRVTGNGSSISVSSLADKRYLMVLCNFQNGANYYVNFNGDTGSNYANRRSANGGGDTQQTSTTGISNGISGSYPTQPYFAIGYVANKSDKEKLSIWNWATAYASGAGNAPYRSEVVGKWANTSNTINEVFISNGQTTTPTEMVILGYDPADSHTNNFWEELASVNTTSGDNLSSGTFTAKKYLWVQMYMKYTSTGGTLHETFNNDTGNNYASRDSYDGGTDGTSTSFTHIDWDRGQQDTYWFINQFIINNASNEKLCIGHQIRIDNTHTGAGTAPHRSERVDKWANTSNQITEIDFDNTTAGIDISNGWLKVWGAD